MQNPFNKHQNQFLFYILRQKVHCNDQNLLMSTIMFSFPSDFIQTHYTYLVGIPGLGKNLSGAICLTMTTLTQLHHIEIGNKHLFNNLKNYQVIIERAKETIRRGFDFFTKISTFYIRSNGSSDSLKIKSQLSQKENKLERKILK